jgi:glycosyltransferase involved in cell wall biosynthesis
VATNRWMEGLIRRSSFFGKFPVSTIPYGLDTDMFQPRPKAAARSLLGLREDAFVILFIAFAVDLRRKGLPFLADALREPIGENTVLLSIGNGTPNLNLSMPAKHIDKVDNDWVLSCIYSAADVFVCPSLQDNLPNTVLEAMACGTPVVAFGSGGIPDMVRPEITGLLASTGDTGKLREGVARLHRDRTKREAMGEAARAVALREYTLEVQARRYVELYNAMLGQSAPRRHALPETRSISAPS